MTKECCLAGLAGTETLIDLVAKLTAHDRHESRVQATWEEAHKAGRTMASASVENYVGRVGCAAGLILADLIGVGGRHGRGYLTSEASTTTRMAWASGLGSGRWQANDGPAYRAAAQAALRENCTIKVRGQEVLFSAPCCEDVQLSFVVAELVAAGYEAHGANLAAWGELVVMLTAIDRNHPAAAAISAAVYRPCPELSISSPIPASSEEAAA